MKKKGFGKGKLNGFGGKVQKNGQTIHQAAIRQTKQQGNIIPTDSKLVGYLKMNFDCQPETFKIFVFRATQFTGEVTQTQQMKPQWFNTTEIPYERMWIDDRHWLPMLLGGKYFSGNFLFQGHEKLVMVEIVERGEDEIKGICVGECEVKLE